MGISKEKEDFKMQDDGSSRSDLGALRELDSVVVRLFLEGIGETSQSACWAQGAVHPFLELFAMPAVRFVIGVLTLVTAETTTELLLALGTLVHEATSALGAAEAASTLGSHAEASKTGLDAGRSLAVPSAGVGLVTKLTERCGG